MDGRPQQGYRWRNLIDGVASVAMIVTSAILVWAFVKGPLVSKPEPSGRTDTVLPKEPVPLAGAPLRGRADAPIAMVEFSDFQCPFCARFAAETLPQILAQFVDPGRVLLAFREFPLDKLHPLARSAAEIAACADESHRFWQVHDSFFLKPTPDKAGELSRRARDAGLTMSELDRCEKEERTGRRVTDDEALARSLSIHGTPTFLIGTNANGNVNVLQVLRGAHSLGDFVAAFEATEQGSHR